MSSLSPKDRVSLCSFTFSDGRRCRTPRIRNHPHFCFYHAQKEARARAAETLGKDLAYFFSGDYLSACDLSTALARLIPAVVRGDVKPKTAHTVAYLVQTLMQAIHLSEHEYTNAFGSDGWRKSVRNSVKGNHDYLFPPNPKPETPAPHPTAPTVGALNVAAGLQPGSLPATPHVHPAPPNPQPTSTPPQPAPVAHPFRGEASSSAPPPKATPPQPAEIPAGCHSERSEEPAFSSFPAPSPTSPRAPQTPASPSYSACHPELSEGSHPIPATQFARSIAPAAQPNNPPRIDPSTPPSPPNRDAYALHFDHNYRLLIDGKPF